MIRNRLIFLFLIQIILVLFIAGTYLRYYLRDSLETELGAKLETIAATVSVNLDAALVSLLGPGDEQTRTYNNLLQQLQKVEKAANIKRIVVKTPSAAVWLDSQDRLPIGTLYDPTGLGKQGLLQSHQGASYSSPLFKGNDGFWYKTGYAPLKHNGKNIGIVAVLGNAESLKVVDSVQKKLYQIGLAALLFSLLLAILTANTLTRPLLNLQRSARQIGRGNLENKVPVHGTGETAVLAQTMEEMRKSILKRDEQQKAMLAGVAHEIRNPLGGIELFAGLLKEELTDSAQKERAEKILKETKNLQGLVQNFIDFGKPIQPKKQNCDILSCWSETAFLLQDKLENIKVVIEGHATIFADPQHIKQIFLNLGINAIQAMGSEGILTIQISSMQKMASVLFIDNGEGIDKDIQQHIFEPFFSNKETGLGLGLAMSKNLIEQNGGSLELLSSGPAETSFKIMVPLA